MSVKPAYRAASMRESLKKVYQALTGRLKAVLDRRYARVDQLEASIAAVRQTQGEISETLRLLQRRMERLEKSMSSAVEELAQVKPGADFVASEDPHELRKKLFAAHRLANECAISIERLLQADLLIRRDLDAISESEIGQIA